MIQAQPASTAVVLTKPGTTTTTAHAKPTLWIWVPWIWLFFASTRTPERWLMWNVPTNVGANDLAGSPVDRAVMIFLMIIGLYVLGARFQQAKKILARNKWPIVFFVFMGLSVLWSNFPEYSLRRFTRSLGAFEMVLVVLTERYPYDAVRIMLQRLYLVHIPLSVIAIKYVRSIGVFYNWSGSEEDWIGLSVDKNSLGQVATCSVIFFLWRILDDWPKRKAKGKRISLLFNCALLGLTLWLLHGSKTVHSSTAIVSSASCALVLLTLQLVKKRAARARRIILGVAVAFGLLLPFGYLACETIGIAPLEVLVEATGRNMTFTDRTYLWTDLLNDAAKNPVFGVGVGAFWVGPPGYDLYPLPNWSLKTPQWRPEEGHNGFIDTYVEIGAIGLILLLVVIGLGFLDALEDLERNFPYGSFRLVLFLSVIISNLTETSFLKGTHDLWFLFLLMAIRIPITKVTAAERLDGTRSLSSNGRGLRLFKKSVWRSSQLSSKPSESFVRTPAAEILPAS